MANSFAPFNFQPQSTVVKTNTTNEAIPAGRYAYVEVNVNNGEFFIDDTEVASGGNNSFTVNANSSPDGLITFNAPAVCNFYWNIANGSVALRDIANGIDYQMGANGSGFFENIGVGPAIGIRYFRSGGNAALVGSAVGSATRFNYWLPEGTEIRVSGDANYVLHTFVGVS